MFQLCACALPTRGRGVELIACPSHAFSLSLFHQVVGENLDHDLLLRKSGHVLAGVGMRLQHERKWGVYVAGLPLSCLSLFNLRLSLSLFESCARALSLVTCMLVHWQLNEKK